MSPEQKRLLVVDNGSQTAHLIARRFHELGVGMRYVDPNEAATAIKNYEPAGIILSGGPASVYEPDSPRVHPDIFAANIPVLGICYGWQDMAQALGGRVQQGHAEYGLEALRIKHSEQILKGLPPNIRVIMSHGDAVTRLPKGFTVLGSTDRVEYAAVGNCKKHLYGVQFHPEASHTEYGTAMLRNFSQDICGIALHPLEMNPLTLVEQIKEQVGDKKVICAVSGGVDSTVAAFLIGQGIGSNLIPVYVDSGLMRHGTTELVRDIFSNHVKADLTIVQARKRFLDALQGVTDPEQKRKIIGKLYADIFLEQARQHNDVAFLGQGTIYSDVIESKGSKGASLIKSHHNVGGLPANLGLTLLEPLRMYYKDQVRKLGRLAGLPEAVVMQQPFPGPGYAVRIRGEVTETRLAQVQQADQIVIEEMKKAGIFESLFQCFAVMTGAYSTAVRGDARAFDEVVAIRAYTSDDVMTSQPADLPHLLVQRIVGRIVNEVSHVSRVVNDVTPKPPATMEWE